MTLRVAVEDGAGNDALAARIGEALQAVTKLRGQIDFATTPDALPNDGKVIEDAREYG
jgi:phenylacetate-CoA ligase